MSRVCELCGKRTRTGNRVSRRGLAKKKGGVGKRITGVTKRKFKPNIQFARAVIEGRVRRVRVCTKCIRSGKIQKAA
jgi:large subunit ribosomal protein L28